MSLTPLLAQTIFSLHPGEPERSNARDGVTDYFACLFPVLHGSVIDSGLDAIFRVYPAEHSVENLALQLGYMSHSLDFDDYHANFRGHPTTVVLSTLLALSKERGTVSADGFLDAYIVGVELAGRLGKAIGTRHYSAGFHSTATLGTIAAAGAACRLLALSQEETQVALGLAATQASGLRSQFGSAAKPLHAGLAARSAVNSALLAQAGFRAQSNGVLESFLQALGFGVEQPQALLSGWGQPWRIVEPGLEFKRYPTCGGTHSAAEAAFVLREQRLAAGQDASPDDIERIEVSFPPGADTAPNIIAPKNGVEARFSLEYVIADALINGSVALEHYSEAPVKSAIAALAARVTRQPDLTAPADELDPDRRFHRVTLWLRDGSTLSHCVTRRTTAAAYTDVQAKLQRSLAALPAPQAQSIINDARLPDAAALHRLIFLISQ
ncbi:MmgE/PrpD family protein [Erwinia rhapontici]|uniref:MmgE/PrpD family protein n=1 Tax=Erwinia TaxID=551 RepID=UPI00105EC4D2|nr:MmgE/PrpD family protein [Erwinia rhapontici]MBP2157274.1 2-methylcitrate dehydratase PrpD [Erwinia rhapontici]TDS90433.1 MmgE/PrpD family protein [Erwinia rhapontici]